MRSPDAKLTGWMNGTCHPAVLISCLLLAVPAAAAELPQRVDFNEHVKPILSDRCFSCHGPDARQRQADLRLDTREGLYRALEFADGSHVVLPGKPQQSELYLRISSEDDGMRMPPPESKLSLTRREIDVLRRWIEQGAPWEDHWSLLPIADVSPPEVSDPSWVTNEIDHFVLARLEHAKLAPSPPADKEQLIRRVTFDLTGLPPTLEEIDTFLADDSPQAYGRVVDRLLASKHFGERMAVDWLDVARYADTYGYQADVYREMWPWRDWVIDAFNENLPYDQFLTWQLAGDLLPDASREQILATAFNRHHRQTNEGGSIEEEFRVEYVADRTNTFGAAMLGLTLECARCHDHKFDPITQREYYQLFAYFNNIDESGLYSHFTDAVPTPTLLLPDDQQQKKIDEVRQQLVEAEERLDEIAARGREPFRQWLADASEAPIPGRVGDYSFDDISENQVVNRADAEQPGKLVDGPEPVAGRVGQALLFSGENSVTFDVGGKLTRNDPFSIACWLNTPDHKDRAVIFHRSRAWTDAGSRGYQLLLEDGRLSASLIHFWPGNAIRIRALEPLPIDTWTHVTMVYDGSSRAAGLQLYVNGRRAECEVVRDNLYKNITGGGVDVLTIGQRFRDRGFKNGKVDEFQIYNRAITPLEVAQLVDGRSLEQALSRCRAEQGGAGESASRSASAADSEALYAYYLLNFDAPYREQLEKVAELRRQRSAAVDPVAEIMVMREMDEPRPTFLLERGAYDAPSEPVQPGTPSSLPPLDENLPRNRLGLARWLTAPDHPLTARVAVNRFWKMMFGQGLVATADDFGSQGAAPTHPQLLDWLARRFIESGWDVKSLLKDIALSSTYRQQSIATEQLAAADPENALLARGPRHRLPAEMIRDNALFVSGLLVDKQGGPPVKPYQPEGLWEEKSGKAYKRDEGAGSHRRSLYSFWKRTSPPPAMITLDAAKRDVCVVQRQTTETPLQALVLLNDPQYVEAARALAERAMSERDDLPERLEFLFRTLTSRDPSDAEREVLRRMYQEQRELFQQQPKAAASLLEVGDAPADGQLDAVSLAATTTLAAALLNYDETVTKR